jgi:MauM/NapG family ferredoxin protein
MQNRKTYIENTQEIELSQGVKPASCENNPEVSRRKFIFSILTTAGAIVFGARFLSNERFGNRASFLRPPGAVDEQSFLKKCIGCSKCMEVCVNDCIVMLDAEAGMKRVNTPIIVPRTKGCTLCMKCTRACPTGALARISPDGPFSRDNVTMGVAKLNKAVCFSYNGRTCGVCYQACPLQGKAMTIGLYEQPTVHDDACVGCGLCEQACLHLPQAIRVLDRKRFI